jgi:hypothetical protein
MSTIRRFSFAWLLLTIAAQKAAVADFDTLSHNQRIIDAATHCLSILNSNAYPADIRNNYKLAMAADDLPVQIKWACLFLHDCIDILNACAAYTPEQFDTTTVAQLCDVPAVTKLINDWHELRAYVQEHDKTFIEKNGGERTAAYQQQYAKQEETLDAIENFVRIIKNEAGTYTLAHTMPPTINHQVFRTIMTIVAQVLSQLASSFATTDVTSLQEKLKIEYAQFELLVKQNAPVSSLNRQAARMNMVMVETVTTAMQDFAAKIDNPAVQAAIKALSTKLTQMAAKLKDDTWFAQLPEATKDNFQQFMAELGKD